MFDRVAARMESDGTIEVKVRVYAMLRRYLPELELGRALVVRLPHGATVGELLDQLGIPRQETKSCFVNGLQRSLGYPLQEGDEVALFPPIAGGS